MKKSIVTLLFVFAMVGFIGIAPAISDQMKMSGTECLAPAGAGGGWDFTCRVPAAQLMQKLDLIDGSMKVVNMITRLRMSDGWGRSVWIMVSLWSQMTRRTKHSMI